MSEKCKTCGKDVALVEGTMFCSTCGANQSYKCPGCGATMSVPDYKFCTNCGTQLYENFQTDKLCECGTITPSQYTTCKRCGKELKRKLME